MPGAATIIAQGNPQQIASFPDWRLPTLIRVVADIGGGSGAATIRAADSSPGTTITRSPTGLYDVTFPPGRGGTGVLPAQISAVVYAATPATAANRRYAQPDASTTNTNVTTGKLRLVTATAVNGAAADLLDGDVFDVAFYVDYGR